MRVLAAFLALLLVAPVAAHGDATVLVQITGGGCATQACLDSDTTTLEAGQPVTVDVTNELDTQQDFMVHVDEDGDPGALIGGVTPVAPGQTVTVEFTVPDGAQGIWYMTLEQGSESGRLFTATEGHGAAGGEDSPGPAVGVLLGVLAFAVLLRRRR